MKKTTELYDYGEETFHKDKTKRQYQIATVITDMGFIIDDEYSFHSPNYLFRFRYFPTGKFQMGDNDFDRWANSVDCEFDLPKKLNQLRDELFEHVMCNGGK